MTTEAYGPREVGVRESKLPPWFIRHAIFDNRAAALVDARISRGRHWLPRGRYLVDWGHLPWGQCYGCVYAHFYAEDTGENVYEGDSLEDAEAAFSLLEQQLLAGTLG